MLFLWIFYALQNLEYIISFHEILSSTTVLKIDNNKKCFLSTNSAY